jgi:hypothetical protein
MFCCTGFKKKINFLLADLKSAVQRLRLQISTSGQISTQREDRPAILELRIVDQVWVPKPDCSGNTFTNLMGLAYKVEVKDCSVKRDCAELSIAGLAFLLLDDTEVISHDR